MGAKGKKKGGKSSKKGKVEELDPVEKNFVLKAEIESLQMLLVAQT